MRKFCDNNEKRKKKKTEITELSTFDKFQKHKQNLALEANFQKLFKTQKVHFNLLHEKFVL